MCLSLSICGMTLTASSPRLSAPDKEAWENGYPRPLSGIGDACKVPPLLDNYSTKTPFLLLVGTLPFIILLLRSFRLRCVM